MPSSTLPVPAASYFEFRSAERVPKTHVWSGPYGYPTVEDTGPDAVPVVDMAAADPAAAVARAAEEWGAFLLVGHSVPAEMVARVQEQIERLFARPAPEKTRAARRPGQSNGYGSPPVWVQFERRMWSEGYSFRPDAVRDEFRRVWLDAGDEYDRFCEAMEDYHREMKALGGKLIDVFFRALGLTDDQIAAGETERKISDTFTTNMHLHLYHKCPDPERAIGLAAHTDSGFFTFIMQSLVPGLQLHRAAPDRWVTVPAMPGAFAVIVGDMFHVLTNGRFQSSLHRAVVNSEQDRISLPYFLGPPPDMTVAPLASAVLPGTKPVFGAVTWSQYMVVKNKLFGTDKSALDMFQIAPEEEEKEPPQN